MNLKKYALLGGYVLAISALVASIGSAIDLRVHQPTAWLVLIPAFLCLWAATSWLTGWIKGWLNGLWFDRLYLYLPIRTVKRVDAFLTQPNPLLRTIETAIIFLLSMTLAVELLAFFFPTMISAPSFRFMLAFGALNVCAFHVGAAIRESSKECARDKI